MVLKQNTTNIENRLDTLPKILGYANKAVITGSVLSISTLLITLGLASGLTKVLGFSIDIRPDVARYLLIFMAVGCSFLFYSWVKQGLDILWTAEFVDRIRVDEIRSHLTGGWLLCSCPLLARFLLFISFISLLCATKDIIFGMIIGLLSIMYLITSINFRLGFFCSNRWEPISRSLLVRIFKPKKPSKKVERIRDEFEYMAIVRAIRRDGVMSLWAMSKEDDYFGRNVTELWDNLPQYISEGEIMNWGKILAECPSDD